MAVARIWRVDGSDHAAVRFDDGKVYKIDVATFSQAGWLSPTRAGTSRVPALVSNSDEGGDDSGRLPVAQIIDRHDRTAALLPEGGLPLAELTPEEAATLADFARQQW